MPLAYLITWATYGTWLPGDARGWVRDGAANTDEYQAPNARLESVARRARKSAPILLSAEARGIVTQTLRAHGEIRRWVLHAQNPRTNHVHVVVSAPVPPEQVMTQLKGWCTRRLREAGLVSPDDRAWARHGSTRYLDTRASVDRAVEYVLHEQ